MNDISYHFIKSFPPNIFFWGGTGQAKVNRPIIEYYKSKLVAVFDDTPNLPSPFDDIPIYYGREQFEKWVKPQKKGGLGFSITIGNPHGRVRLKLHNEFVSQNLIPVSVIHPSAIIAKNAVIGEGVQIMAGAIIQPEVRIGKQCILNTKSSVDHECVIEDGVEISPGATLCGSVYVGTNVWIGAGAVIFPRVRIGNNAIIGAGSVVRHDVPADVTVVGVPARELKSKKI